MFLGSGGDAYKHVWPLATDRHAGRFFFSSLCLTINMCGR